MRVYYRYITNLWERRCAILTIAEQNMEMEEKMLSPFACLAKNSRGREIPIPPCEVRTVFQRDRDRIVHAKSFRRLMHKTQVFLSPEDDHYRTRLTHTLEVTQIAKTISRGLRLNEDLCEAAALGHDLGHTPFGHAGEKVLQENFSPDFTHYRQSLRVVEKLENGGKGLNLTFEVRDGIVHHSGSIRKPSGAATLEGSVVKFSDKIAYINHDIDDAIRGKILSEDDIPRELSDILGYTHSERIATMVKDLIYTSEGKPVIAMSPEILDATDRLRAFLHENVYINPAAKAEEIHAMDMLAKLYEYLVKNPEKMPEEFLHDDGDSIERKAADYIAGMTDRYAINLFEDLFIPKLWKLK